VLKVIRDLASTHPRLDGFEVEVDQELKKLNRARNVNGTLVPIEALSPWRRDLTTGLPVIQTTVSDEAPIPVLRAKTVCGRLGATIIDGLVSGQLGNLKMPRTTLGGIASWQPETGGASDNDQNLDSFTLIPKRITGSTVLSRQLISQSSPDVEAFVANDLTTAIGVAVDNAALNGSRTAPQPLGILNVPANAAGSYVYSQRSASVTFGGAASWGKILAFEKTLEQGLVANDGSYGWAIDPTVRDKWQQTAILSGFPRFLWENSNDDAVFGYVNGRRAISSTQLPAGQVLFARWSDLLICTWVGVEILTDPYSLATQGEVRVRASLLADIGFRYALAFCASTDSGAQ
jgi:HK97 family phage major capsid protein